MQRLTGKIEFLDIGPGTYVLKTDDGGTYFLSFKRGFVHSLKETPAGQTVSVKGEVGTESSNIWGVDGLPVNVEEICE